MKKFDELKKVHVVGIGGSAVSAVAEILLKNGVRVTGSDMAQSATTRYLSSIGIKIFDNQCKENLMFDGSLPDLVLISPALLFLDPNNTEIVEAKKNNILVITWQEFLGDYLNSINKKGLLVSGSEGKGTTCGILTWILKGTEFDPLAILGAKLKNINEVGENSNIYRGNGSTYILEADEFNKNFHNYHPEIGMMVNFQYEHPEFYKNWNEYKKSFFDFFKNMVGTKTLIFRATQNMIDFVDEYELTKTHKVIWYKNIDDDVKKECDYLISKVKATNNQKGVSFMLETPKGSCSFVINALPLYLANNGTAAIICALELGLSLEEVWTNIQRFTGLERRFDMFTFGKDGVIFTDYGHSPSSIRQVVKEIRNLFPNKKIHLVFQPHLFSRTYNFLDEFLVEYSKVDKVSLVDIYPAREKKEDWEDKISSKMLEEKLRKAGIDATYIGESKDVDKSLDGKVIDGEVTLFMGAGDMDKSYVKLLEKIGAKN